MLFIGRKSFFKKIKLQKMNYNVDPDFIDKLLECNLDGDSQELIPLDKTEKYRSVFFSKKINAVIKNNTLKSFRRRLYTHFGIHGLSGRFSLVDEYNNLVALSHVDFVPKVYAFGRCDSFPVKKECLIIEYYEDSLTADEMIRMYPDKKALIIKSVFQLFLKAWNNGFTHMDPHLKNILFLKDGTVKFIDFECCYLNPKDKEFCIGFSTGYFFYFWFHKYISNEEYSLYVQEFVAKECSGLDMDLFYLYHDKFKNNKVSRSRRYKCFSSAGERKKLIN